MVQVLFGFVSSKFRSYGLTRSVVTGTVDPTNSYLTWRIRNKKSNQKPTWFIEIFYSSYYIFVLAMNFWRAFYKDSFDVYSANTDSHWEEKEVLPSWDSVPVRTVVYSVRK